MAKIKPWIPIYLIGVFFLALIIFRPTLLEWLSKFQQSQLSENTNSRIEKTIEWTYNYTKNKEVYSYTLLEFSSTRCSACKQMEQVTAKIKERYRNKVKVVLVNVMDKSNKDLVDYFGIVSIPFQVLLDKNAKEFYRHSGYISEIEIAKYFK